MNDFVFSIMSRFTAVSCGFLSFAWYRMDSPKIAILIAIVGFIDPNWAEYFKKKSTKKKTKKTIDK